MKSSSSRSTVIYSANDEHLADQFSGAKAVGIKRKTQKKLGEKRAGSTLSVSKLEFFNEHSVDYGCKCLRNGSGHKDHAGSTMKNCHQQPSEETDDIVEDTTYKIPPPGYVDESNSDDEVLVKRIKKIKEGTKSKPKKMELRVKKSAKSQPGKKEDLKKSPKPPVKIEHLLVTKHKKEDKSPKKKQHIQKSAAIPIEGPKSVQSVPKPAEGDTKHKKIFQSRLSPSGFVGMITHFNEAQTKAIQEMGFGGFLHLQVTELPGDLCKWLVDRFDPYSVTLYISQEKRIKITPMDVHVTLALPIGGKKVEEFYGEKPKDATYNQVLDAWRKD
ncbi:hypothetical protein Cgig2_015868 [Carnegiea gigantea]|uniref:Uncharacterized protein n=1 Tax=Carnegiea gigantea TaxID=171969 RepID=A0A9Q1JN75_9CARY|nr:hypothetical protein Cgig2_015868 [Carnegiea gigantea]